MIVFAQIRLLANAVHAAHLGLLPELAIIFGLWALVSLIAGLLLGYGVQVLRSRDEIPKEILEAPPEPETQSESVTSPFDLRMVRLSRRLLSWKPRRRIV